MPSTDRKLEVVVECWKRLRQVMTGKEWLTVEDWLELEAPLTAVSVRHEGRQERADADAALRVCFSSSRLGGDVLAEGTSQVRLHPRPVRGDGLKVE